MTKPKNIPEIIKQGKQKGRLTYAEINNLLPQDNIPPEDFDRILVLLGNEDVKIVPDPETRAQHEENEIEYYKKHYDKKKTGKSNSISTYLKEISRTPLLSQEEEITLAKDIETHQANLKKILLITAPPIRKLLKLKASQIRKTVKFKDKDLEKILSQLKDLLRHKKTPKSPNSVRKAKVSLYVLRKLLRSLEKEKSVLDDTRQKLIEANLRLVVSVAKKYTNRGLSLLDLIQEGNLGLRRAVDKFEYQRGYKFSTYACWWIRQAITRALAYQSRTIRLPVHMNETINRLRFISRNLVQKYGREPTPEELSQAMHLPVEKVRGILKISLEPLSLETPIGETGDSSLAEIIKDEDVVSPPEVTSLHLLQEEIEKVLTTLPEKEQQVIKLRFGLEDGVPRTLEEIGRIFKVTRERIRQIETKALQKLRNPKRSENLKEFLDLDDSPD